MCNHFKQTPIHSWDEFTDTVAKLGERWIYRGQTSDWRLAPTLERSLCSWDVGLDRAPALERKIIRDFRRRYRAEDHHSVRMYTLYCLSVMQHHRAPTRLLDWTYSPYVAAKFAAEQGTKGAVIWCLNADWCAKKAKDIQPELKKREGENRKDHAFIYIYMRKARKMFARPENPFCLNERLTLQQGLFLCPGDITVPFEDNLRAMPEWDLGENILKLMLKVEGDTLLDFASNLNRMNLNSAVLFPGLDGFGFSFQERILHYNAILDQEQ